MGRKTLNILTGISTVMLAAAAVLFVSGFAINPLDHYLSFGDDFHVGVWGRGLDSRIVFFNNAEYGPYQGSIICLTDDNGNGFPQFERKEGFGDSWGIYYRYFQWSDATLWTLTVSLWYPIAVFTIIPAIRLVRCGVNRFNANAA